MEVLSVWLAGALLVAALVIIGRSSASASARVALGLTMVTLSVALARPRKPDGPMLGPRITHDGGYIGSGACRACHPSEHASWSRTYHRTMTQRGTAPIAITTGSHHMQGFWTEDDHGALHMLAYVWATDERRLIPRSEAFLEPPDAPQHDVRWSTNCIACHATSGRPLIDDKNSVVAELGIACEACHGPGRIHAEREANPFVRYWGKGHEADIVNPERLPPELASAVCGACHAYSFPRSEEAFLKTGYESAFHPGDALEPSRIMITPEVLEKGSVRLDTDTRNLFWPDGTVRVGGREYNAMVLSACYLRGEGKRKITCMSCHSMHRSDPDDQLRGSHQEDQACVSCHSMPTNHTHHAGGSAGSACVACHMPKTSYALRTAIRSHRIDSPAVGTDKPNACNLCHLARSVSWAAQEMSRLWGTPMPTVQVDVPASVVGLLRADAAERVIWADAFGDPNAIRVSGDEWERSVLTRATTDPYAVVRFIVERSMQRYPPLNAAHKLASAETLDALVSHRDNREVYVAE